MKRFEQSPVASQRVADITGLPLDLVQRNFARIPTSLFAREFARKGSRRNRRDGGGLNRRRRARCPFPN
jgi:hypothetical protein